MKKNILIVGGTGFLGSHLVKKCINKFNITSLSLHKPKNEKKFKNVKYITADISNQKVLSKKIKRNFDIVVNLGGYINHNDKNLAINTHLNGCKNLINFFKKKKN